MKTPPDFNKWNRSHQGAYRKGYEAGMTFRRSGSKTACPYLDHRKADGRLTFARAYRKCWWLGFDTACGKT